MTDYFRQRWKKYWTTKGWFSKISDLIFVLLVIGMLIPASRKEISAFFAGIMAFSPKTLAPDSQTAVNLSTLQWSLTDDQGKTVDFSAFAGQTIFLNFWATWCPPCIAELPDIQELYDGYHEKAAFVLVTDESPATVQAFMQRKGYQLPVYYHRGFIPEVFASASIPTTFVVSPEGKIIIRKTGAAKWNSSSMQQTLDELWKNSR